MIIGTKAPQGNAQTKALSKSLQIQRRTKMVLKNFPTLKKIKNATHKPTRNPPLGKDCRGDRPVALMKSISDFF